jgi:16S rRNA U516 pseudouridylate synthase RsuA-like enzyme
MLTVVGHEVLGLARTAIGPIRDPGLRSGEWRLLTAEEVRSLYRAAGFGPASP